MTVTGLIKKLQQWRGNPAIVSVHIEFGDGSIYHEPESSKAKRYRITVGGVDVEFTAEKTPTPADYKLFEKWVRTGQIDENASKELERRGIRRVS